VKFLFYGSRGGLRCLFTMQDVPIVQIVQNDLNRGQWLNGWNILNSTLYYFMFKHSIIPLF
jgi:hypothetical protein